MQHVIATPHFLAQVGEKKYLVYIILYILYIDMYIVTQVKRSMRENI